jgi:mono/diheme cytochrome c family protein
MRLPPPGTVSRDRILGHSELTQGMAGAAYVTTWPVPVTRALLERGRDRFDITCAACHGVRGDGVSEVARHMSMRKPPSLLDHPVSAFPPGRLFNVITFGYGLMPAYDTHLSLTDRWATVAYVRALQLSQRAPLDTLPASLRAEAEAALR